MQLLIIIYISFCLFGLLFANNKFPKTFSLLSPNSKNELLEQKNIIFKTLINIKGGDSLNMGDNSKISVTKKQNSLFSKLLMTWGVLGVVSILGNAIKRVIPVALQPFKQNDLSNFQWAIYALWSLYMTYAEGFQAFHLKFSPLVVRRAYELSNKSSILNWLLAGPFSMGLFSATKKRIIISWAITAGVFTLVQIVKKLPYPWRSIIDGGVVFGLSFGTLSILWYYLKTLVTGKPPDVDPCFEEMDKKEK